MADELDDEELLELDEEDEELLDSSSLVSLTTGAGSTAFGTSCLGADFVDEEEDELLELEEEDELDSSSFLSCTGAVVWVTTGWTGFLLLELELELEDEESFFTGFSVLGFSSLGAGEASCTIYFCKRCNHSAFASAVSANKSQSEYFPSVF